MIARGPRAIAASGAIVRRAGRVDPRRIVRAARECAAVSALVLAAAAATACTPKPEPADLVLLSGHIHTVDPARPWAEAVAVRGDRIARVGDDGDVEPLVGPATRVHRLAGALVLPGLIDGHSHFLDGSLGLSQVDLTGARTLGEILERVRAYAAAHPDRPWIVGFGWEYSAIPGRLPHRRDLDGVEAARPVFLYSYDGHTGWCNTAALRAAGLLENAPDLPPSQGEVVRDPRGGAPTGALLEGAMGLVEEVVPKPTREEKIDALVAGLRHAASLGLTSVQNMSGGADEIELYDALEKEGRLTLRTVTAFPMPSSPASLGDGDIARMVAARDAHQGPYVRAGLVKFFVDGVIETNTAAMLAPYTNDPARRGTPRYDARQLEAMVRKVDAAGLQIAIHAIGDAGVRMALDALERAIRERPGRARRHRLEHIETIDPADIPRFGDLGVLASMQPYHAYPPLTGVWADNIGPERVARAFAWNAIRSAGGRLVHGSDWPVVTLDPMAGLRNAVLRQNTEGQPEGGWVPEQRLTLEQAIAGYTINGAFATFEEDVKGSITEGKYADLVVLSQDLFKIPPERIHETRAVLTIVGGRVVHEAQEAAAAPSAAGRAGGVGSGGAEER